MFDKLTNMIDNALTVVTAPLFGELPTQRQVALLIADGLSVYAIAEIFGVGADVIEGLIGDRDNG